MLTRCFMAKGAGNGELVDKLAVLLHDVQYLNGNFYFRESLTGTLLRPETDSMLVIVDGIKGVSLDEIQTYRR